MFVARRTFSFSPYLSPPLHRKINTDSDEIAVVYSNIIISIFSSQTRGPWPLVIDSKLLA
jgi:hypothetical protein